MQEFHDQVDFPTTQMVKLHHYWVQTMATAQMAHLFKYTNPIRKSEVMLCTFTCNLLKIYYTIIVKIEKTTLSSRQACFAITHSSGYFNDKSIHNYRLNTINLKLHNTADSSRKSKWLNV